LNFGTTQKKKSRANSNVFLGFFGLEDNGDDIVISDDDEELLLPAPTLSKRRDSTKVVDSLRAALSPNNDENSKIQNGL
jgi:hypothetical protein